MKSSIMRPLLIVAALMMSVILASAADMERFLVRGYLYMDNWTPVDSAEVVSLMKNDTIPVEFKVLNSYGKSNKLKGAEMRLMVNSGMGDYTLVIEKDGLETFVKRFSIASRNDETKYIGAMQMKREMTRSLDEVTVTATRVKMVMKGDTMVFDAGAFQLKEGSMLDALVRQLPGATLDEDGVITVNGRKINELLVNGKDFFKGDPKVALQNLPSYTVKNLKVYDKAAKNAYLTKSDAKWVKREDEENLVMDVNLKKEYMTGWTANVEAGGGTDSRWKLRGFGLGYTEKFRLALYGNFNNVGDTETASSRGGWGSRTIRYINGAAYLSYGGGNSGGENTVKKGGFDYSFKDKKVSIEGNASASHTNNYLLAMQSAMRFYPERDLFDRSTADKNSRQSSLSTYHNLEIRGDNMFVSIRPELNWNVNNGNGNTRSATFTANPVESFRGEAIDSLFSRGSKSSFAREMLNSIHNMQVSHGTSLNTSLSVDMTYAPKTMKGNVNVNLSGAYGRTPGISRTEYFQTLGALAGEGHQPLNSDRYNSTDGKSRNMRASANYTYKHSKFNETRSNSLYVRTAAMYVYQNINNSADMLLAELDADPDRLPSLNEPANAVRDYDNSYYSRSYTNHAGGNLSLNFQSQPLAPGDSTFNLSYYLYGAINYSHRHEVLDYDKPQVMYDRISRNLDFVTPSIGYSMSSDNKLRNLVFNMSASMSMDAVPMNRLLNTVDNSDPFNIYIGRPEGLKNSMSYYAQAGFMYFSKGSHRNRIMTDMSWNVRRNAIAMARTYNPETGVSILSPANINGNWNIRYSFDYNVQVGPRNQVELHGWFSTAFLNSVDFLAVNTTPVRSSVRNFTFNPNVGAAYRFKNGSSINTGWGITWDKATSPRADFTDINSHTITGNVQGVIKLPADIELNTSLNAVIRRGFSDASLNSSNWVWNADLSKSFLKRKVMTLKLSAYDILNSMKAVSVNVNAQGRVETWTNTMRRYVMLSAIYRFDMKPKNQR